MDVETILVDPSITELEVVPLRLFATNTDHDLSRFSSFENDNHLIGLGSFEISIHEVVSSTSGSIEDRHPPCFRAVDNPVSVLTRNVSQSCRSNGVDIAAGIKEALNPLGLIEGLDASIEKNAVKALVLENDVMLVVLVEGVHGFPPMTSSSREG